MILVDSSVWIEHIRRPSAVLMELLLDRQLLMHPLIIGELAMGNLPQRGAFIALLDGLTPALLASHGEVMRLVETDRLHGRGVGFVDAHLLASTRLTGGARLWSRDARLAAIGAEMSIAWSPT